MELRKCIKCGVEKELSPEHFSKTNHFSGTRYRKDCFPCQVATRKEWVDKNKERLRAKGRAYSRNKYANLTTEQKKAKNAQARLVRRGTAKYAKHAKDYRARNPGAARASSEKWRKKNPDKATAIYERNKHKKIVRSAEEREKLHDRYVLILLRDGNTLKVSDIPKELIDAKRLQLKLKRAVLQLEENK